MDWIPYSQRKDIDMSELVGLTFASVENHGCAIEFKTEDGRRFLMHHEQDCCESVCVDDIAGDLQDLVDSPILLAEEVDGQAPSDFDPSGYESYTWTFYKLATRKGYVDIRWFGYSNGYYSERADLVEVLSEPSEQ